MNEPTTVKTDQIPLEAIDEDALKVVRRLRRHGHDAYLVGGCVRDLLNGVEPKDFDVITSARPRQVRRLFGNSRVIGRRFRLVHVIFGDNIIEVSTFRADPDEVARRLEDEGAEAEQTGAADSDPADASDEADPADADDEADLADDEEDLADGEDDLADDEEDLEDDLADDEEDADEEDADEEDADEEDADEEDADEEDESRGRGRGRRRRRERDDSEFEANNMFGEPDQDARRRDFTINALLFDPDESVILDYTGGMQDIERRLVNPIRDPEEAFAEDPVRMIRAVRFAAKLHYSIADNAAAAIANQGHLIADCSQRRLLEEIFKILGGGYATRSFELLCETGLDAYFWPEVAAWVRAAPVALPLRDEAGEGDPAAKDEAEAEAEAEEAAEDGDGEAEAEDSDADDDAEDDDAEDDDAEDDDAEDDDDAVAAEGDHEAEAAGAESASAESPPEDPRANWGEPAEIEVGGGQTIGFPVFPQDPWIPGRRLIDAYLRVTWERPLPEGANDWVEDPHVYLEDALLEAAAFAREVHYDYLGRPELGGVASERERAVDVLRMLRWEGRLEQVVVTPPPEEKPAGEPRRERERGPRRRRRSGATNVQDVELRAGPVIPRELPRAEVLRRYMEQMDHLTDQGVPLSNALRMTVLFAPLLLGHLDATLGADPRASAEEATDELLHPMALRHSLARKDRDRIKRIIIVLRRLLTGEARQRSKGRDRLLAREHFREAIVVLWIHLRAFERDLEPFHFWQAEAKRVPLEKVTSRGGNSPRRRRRRR